eukprot:884095-Pleurochrysis_carterae.AAC.1
MRGKDCDAVRPFSHAGLSALYLNSEAHECCFDAQGSRERESGSKKAVGLCEWFKYCLNQRKNDPDLAGLELVAAAETLLLKWGAVPLSGIHFDAPHAAVAPAEASAAWLSLLLGLPHQEL